MGSVCVVIILVSAQPPKNQILFAILSSIQPMPWFTHGLYSVVMNADVLFRTMSVTVRFFITHLEVKLTPGVGFIRSGMIRDCMEVVARASDPWRDALKILGFSCAILSGVALRKRPKDSS